ncbi:AtpZ/AtpI family protein [Aquimarina mytili]|uniref:AtpZ/AtpI family protein n=1 Tax=Aquimarina mytili TaxID=874423 RepID=A0A936ZTY7_9FLAO|nr:AtpZ/AtpI family protein [Aquimarina mytili]MBL0684648.1 AtpZ/AtpI family protein [Aquimarina mytili]
MEKEKNSNKNQLRRFAILTGIAFEMGAIIFSFAYIGEKLDTYYELTDKWFTIFFVLLGVATSLYLVIKQLNKINKSN